MVSLAALWLPILLSAVIVFIASSIVHMAMPWHKNDYPRIPNEDKFMDALRPFAVPPGDYMVPRPATREEMRSPQFLEKVKQGPVMVVTVLPNRMMSMGSNLAQWFVYLILVSLLAAYVAGRAVPAGTRYLTVFRFAGTTAFIGYSVALIQMSIWYRRAWSTTVKALIDGLLYGCLTAGTFGWLWPK